MSKEGKVKTATKIEAEEAKKLDPKELVKTFSGEAAEGEVEAQGYLCTTYCPWCGSYLRAICSSEVYRRYTCAACGGLFRM
jgi:transposase-like protein